MDGERSGRPANHSQGTRSALLDLALQKPRNLRYPFELWTLERLQNAFKERHGVHLSDSTIWTWVEAEGFRWRKQESWFREPEKHDPEFAEKKGLIVAAYTAPPTNTRTICLDELGPLTAKTYPGFEWVLEKSRATYEPDYGRRGKVWVHGALEPATGQATFVLSAKQDSATHIQLLEKVIQTFPADRLLIVQDNLSSHHSHETKIALAAWPEIQILFLPKNACLLNLIEPWWKRLKSLALQGRRFENQSDLETALWSSLDYWNQHRHPCRWKKKPQE